MSLPIIATVLDGEERDEAKEMDAGAYLRSARYRGLRERIFQGLDANVETMRALEFPNPYDGRVIGSYAATYVRKDGRALGILRKRKIEALDTDKDRYFELCGCLIAEDYLRSRKDLIPLEPLIASPVGLKERAGELFGRMEQLGRELSTVVVGGDDLVVTFANDDPSTLADAVIDAAIARYETIVPETDEDSDVPDEVERRAISRAAFLQLTADELLDVIAETDLGFDEVPTKAEMVRALTDRFGNDIDAVARLVLRRGEGEPAYGLITRLVPLEEEPDLARAETMFNGLQGHYVEAKTAVFFLFGDVQRVAQERALRIAGRVRSFSVAPAAIGNEVRMSPRSRTDDVEIILRAGQTWAEVSARRLSELSAVRNVIRRMGLPPASSVIPPDAIPVEPFDTWDGRTLWMLEFLRRDLQQPELLLDDMLMANFVLPRRRTRLAEGDERRQPNVDAVRLLGRQLQDHPEACARIASGSHLRDIEVRLAQVARRGQLPRSIRVRLSWEADHLAVMSGADASDRLDAAAHRELVRLVREAASRPLQRERLLGVLRNIQARATEGEVGADVESVFTGVGAAPAA